jgi:hypothetical protein
MYVYAYFAYIYALVYKHIHITLLKTFYGYKNLGENKYRVPKGSEIKGEEPYGLQDAEKKLRIIDLPDMLCLTLKRFNYDVSTSSMTKVCIYLYVCIQACLYVCSTFEFMYACMYTYVCSYKFNQNCLIMMFQYHP